MALGFAPVRANSEISRPRCKSVANYWVKTGVILSILASDLSLRNALDYLVWCEKAAEARSVLVESPK